MKYRIKHIPSLGWYAQCKPHKLFFAKWYKIGKHTTGFGLYPEDNIDIPLASEQEAEQRCQEYENFQEALDNEPLYINVQVKVEGDSL